MWVGKSCSVSLVSLVGSTSCIRARAMCQKQSRTNHTQSRKHLLLLLLLVLVVVLYLPPARRINPNYFLVFVRIETKY